MASSPSLVRRFITFLTVRIAARVVKSARHSKCENLDSQVTRTLLYVCVYVRARQSLKALILYRGACERRLKGNGQFPKVGERAGGERAGQKKKEIAVRNSARKRMGPPGRRIRPKAGEVGAPERRRSGAPFHNPLTQRRPATSGDLPGSRITRETGNAREARDLRRAARSKLSAENELLF